MDIDKYQLPFFSWNYKFMFRVGVHDYYEHKKTKERKYHQWTRGYSALDYKWLGGGERTQYNINKEFCLL